MYNLTSRRVRVTIVAVEKQQALHIPGVSAKFMHCIILSSVACLTVPYLSTLSHKQHDFRQNVIGNKTCVLNFFTNLKYFLL
jgi:hypothetical protein